MKGRGYNKKWQDGTATRKMKEQGNNIEQSKKEELESN